LPSTRTATSDPSPAARDSQRWRISLNPAPLLQIRMFSLQASESARNNVSASPRKPSAFSEVAG
jgi:hypothetical protein